MSSKADFYFGKETRWQAEIKALRSIVLDCQLEESLKWGCPCYTLNGSNIVLIHVFKEYCALLLFKGALMADPEEILVQQTKNVRQPRQIRFTDLPAIEGAAETLKAYIREAIRVEQAGLKMAKAERAPLDLPEEFLVFLHDDTDLKTAFEALSPGRQRAYNLHFSAPKQSKTRTARIQKAIPQILDGKGLND